MYIRTYAFFALLSAILSLPQWIFAQAVYQDKPFIQDYSVKYYFEKSGVKPLSLAADRNGTIQVLSSEGLQHVSGGEFLYPGTLSPDRSYRAMYDMQLKAVGSQNQQLVYLTDKAVLSNAWAGKLYAEHGLPNAKLFAGTPELSFLVSDGSSLQLVQNGKSLWKGSLPASDEVIGIQYQALTKTFWILSKKALYILPTTGFSVNKVFEGTGLTAFTLAKNNQRVIIGTTDGYIELDATSKKAIGAINRHLPWTEITVVTEIGNKIWFGTTKGAFALRPDGKFDYYYGERWLPGNNVTAITEGPENSLLVLTDAGLGKISFKAMTLYDKAVFFDKQVRSRHIRNGFNASFDGLKKGDLATGFLADSDNDGLWTSMYLAGEVFRYVVTKDKAALQNCRESLDAMERLYTINPVPGFPARSFERESIKKELSDSDRWVKSPESGWVWKSTTSSDEAIGHIFAFGAMAELLDDKDLKNRAITLIDTLMSHVVRNDMYLVDFDGKPTLWGKWHPSYVNSFPTIIGDRKINSSNIIGMLQTAYHFTKKEKYKAKAYELMNKYGYLENLMRPMKEINYAPDTADDWAKKLSEGWNHSDDEMYFVGYWGLYRYAFTPELKAKFKQSIIDHWEAERPEKEGAWNIFTAMVGTKTFDLPEAVWFLKEHPLDLITWSVMNSHRKDIDTIPVNFRGQTTKEVLPPDERPIQRHNGNMFRLDRNGDGASEYSAGDIWLLPYWMGRYLGVISAPMSTK